MNKAKTRLAHIFGQRKPSLDEHESSEQSLSWQRLPQYEQQAHSEWKSFIVPSSAPNWIGSDYKSICSSGYVENVIAHRCVNMIATGASQVPLKLYSTDSQGKRIAHEQHPALEALKQPNRGQACIQFMKAIYCYRMISGNVFLRAKHNPNLEIEVLRPDEVSVITSKPEKYTESRLLGYRIKKNGHIVNYPMQYVSPKEIGSRRDAGGRDAGGDGPTENGNKQHNVRGSGAMPGDAMTRCDILHIKDFHPMNDLYGLSSMEVARYAIDQRNEMSSYSKSLLQNSARPSGALVVKSNEFNKTGNLSDEQYARLRDQLEGFYTGKANVGRPLLLEGGLDWKEMSISPKDMDFIEHKHCLAREIALAFGVPPQMLGIPGDNTYSNMMEARRAMWEQTIIPMMREVLACISNWLPHVLDLDPDFYITFDADKIAALEEVRNMEWDRISSSSFLTSEEKKAALGL